MNYINEILVGCAGLGTLLIAFVIMKLIKLKKLPIMIASLIIVVGFGALGTKVYLDDINRSKQEEKINYMASYLIDIEKYDAAMSFMLDNDSDNEVLQQLQMLDLALNKQYTVALSKADAYLMNGSNDIVKGIKDACSVNNDSKAKEQLISLHSKIKDNINASVDDNVLKSFAVIMDKTTGGSVAAGDYNNSIEILRKQNDAAIQKLVTQNDKPAGQKLIEATRAITENQASLSNKILVANAVATSDVASDDEEIADLEKEISELEKKISELNTQMAKLDNASSKAEEFEKKIAQYKKDYEQTKKDKDNLAILRAQQYLDICTTNEEKDTPLYKSEQSVLEYMKGNTDKAKEEMLDAVKLVTTQGNAGAGSTSVMMLMDAYSNADNSSTASSSGTGNKTILQEDAVEYIYNQLSQGIISESKLTDGSQYFSGYVKSLFDDLGQAMFISNITTDDYDNYYVDLYINIDSDNTQYTKEDFSIYDMNEKVTDYEIVKDEEQEKTNICFVMDVSGSMSGTSISDAKKSAINFINSIPTGTNIGLVSFESSAKQVTKLSASTGLTSKGIDSLGASGGTNISSGLLEGIESFKGVSGRKIIILMTDGEDSSSSQNQMNDVKQKLAAEGIMVYAVGFGSANDSYLSDIAKAGNGKYISATDANNLASVYATFNRYISNDYHLRFKVSKNTELFSRDVKVICNGYYVNEKAYTVGLSSDEIKKETQTPMTDYFYQVGGSNKTVD